MLTLNFIEFDLKKNTYITKKLKLKKKQNECGKVP